MAYRLWLTHERYLFLFTEFNLDIIVHIVNKRFCANIDLLNSSALGFRHEQSFRCVRKWADQNHTQTWHAPKQAFDLS